MNKIEKLIEELCPDGVEYKKLGEIADIVRGNGLAKSDFTDSGVGCVHYGQIYTRFGLYADKTLTFVNPELAKKLKKVNKGDLIVTITSENYDDICKCVVWLGDEEIVTGGHAAIIKHKQNPKYLAYCFGTVEFFNQKVKAAQGTKVMEISPERLGKIVIPVPPLEVQQEIVKILDDMVALQESLEQELEKRKNQYEVYQRKLLAFDDGVSENKLCDVCDYVDYRGKTPKKTSNGIFLVTAKNIRPGYIDYSCSAEYIAEADYEEVMHRGKPEVGDVLFTTEAPCGYVAQVDRTDIALAQRVIKYRSKDSNVLDNTYLKYILLGEDFQKELFRKAVGGTVKGIQGSKLHQMVIPVPSLEEQQRIVEILDSFDKLCNESLPAEINARRKQYEYYRDKLMTFKRKAV